MSFKNNFSFKNVRHRKQQMKTMNSLNNLFDLNQKKIDNKDVDSVDSTTFESPMSQIWGDYRLLEKIGEGFQSTVYKAINKKTNQIYALKITSTVDEELQSIFKREYSLLKSLDHPNLLKVYDFINMEDSGYQAIVAEYLDFQTLKMFTKKKTYNKFTLEKRIIKTTNRNFSLFALKQHIPQRFTTLEYIDILRLQLIEDN